MAAEDAPLLLLVCGNGNAAKLERASPAMVVARAGNAPASLLGWCEANGTPLVSVAGSEQLALRVAMTLADRMDADEMRIGLAAFPGCPDSMRELARAAKVRVWQPGA